MLILNIQHWHGDTERAMELARLIADLEPQPRKDIKVLFTARFDTKQDRKTIDYVSKKFETYELTCKRTATGWPNGPNQMMGESYSYCVERSRAGKFGDVKAVMFIESDCVPLHRDWINKLIEEYTASKKMVLGAWLTRGDCNCEHVNGNLIMSLDFWRQCKAVFHPQSRGGWDATLAHAIMPNAAPSKLIWSDYQLGMPHNPWRGPDYLWAAKRYQSPTNPLYGQDLYPVYFHGVKVAEGLKCARERLLK
jgi:hypothetical protein